MDRILQNTPATISESWYQGATIQDPGVVAVTVTRDDGTTVTSGAATGAGAAPRTFQLTAAHTASLDKLTATWVSGTLGTLMTTIEVVGDFLFTINEARGLRPLDNAVSYTDAQIQAMRTTVEDAIENELGFATVPRYSKLSFGGRPRWPLRLKPFLRTIRSLSTAGQAMAAPDVAALPFDENGFLFNGSYSGGYSWYVDGEFRVAPYGPIVVGFEHGMDRPPERVRRAALLLAKVWLVAGPVDDRASTFSSSETGATYSMIVPGRGGSTFGVPEVDATVDQYRIPALV